MDDSYRPLKFMSRFAKMINLGIGFRVYRDGFFRTNNSNLLQVLDEMEATATDSKDKPTTEIKLISAHLFVDSISDTKEELINAEKEKKKAAKEAEKSKVQ